MAKKINIIFDKSLKKEILEIFDKKVDDSNIIVEKDNPTQKVLTPEGEEINIEEFAGIINGSEIFIKSDVSSLIEISKRKKEL